MKKVILVTLGVVLASLPLVAVENDSSMDEFQKQFREKNDIILRVGVDALGTTDDTTLLANNAGKKGSSHQMGFELSVGAEEKVENLELGARRLMTFYSFGNTYYHDGLYNAKMKNFGVETTGASYWKLTQYFKPYLGLGMGVNVNQYDDSSQYLDSQAFQLTVHGVAGVSGELVSGLGYYAEYKYRFAPTQTVQATLQDGTKAEVKNNSVDGGEFIAGISLQF